MMLEDHDKGGAAPAAPQVVPGRACGSCTLCCKLIAVTALAKPPGTWCAHCVRGEGCGIYETRPGECAHFICGFLSMTHLGEEWRPLHSKLIMDIQTTEGSMIIYVDPARPDAWRRAPYYAMIREWARRALARNKRVTVRIGERIIVVLPDHAIDLGAVATDEVIVVTSSWAAANSGASHVVYAAKSDAWAKMGPAVLQGKQVPSLVDGFRLGTRLD